MTDAIPQPLNPPGEEFKDRRLVVLSEMFVHGAVGEIIKLRLSANQLLSLLQSGAVKEAPPEKPPVAPTPPPPVAAPATAPAATTEGKVQD